MNVTQKTRDLLPLKRAGHGNLVSVSGALVASIYASGIGRDGAGVTVAAANEMQLLIPIAVNAHEALVRALAEMIGALGEIDVLTDRMKAATTAACAALQLVDAK